MFIIGIAGGSGCGKTTVVRKVTDSLEECHVAIISQDSYYRDNSHLSMEERQRINFDHPQSLEFDLLASHIRTLKAGTPVDQPVYSYLSCTRQNETVRVEPTQVIIVEGILIFTQAELRDIFDLKVFVDAEPDDRLSRIIHRDLQERGRGLDKVLERYYSMVKPMHIQFIEPSKRFADIIIPQGGENEAAIKVLSSLIKDRTQVQ